MMLAFSPLDLKLVHVDRCCAPKCRHGSDRPRTEPSAHASSFTSKTLQLLTRFLHSFSL